MAPIYCCMINCWDSNKESKHRFPNPAVSPDLFNTWVKLTGNKRLIKEMADASKIYINCRVCARHFADDDFTQNRKLKKGVIPSKNLPTDVLDDVILAEPKKNKTDLSPKARLVLKRKAATSASQKVFVENRLAESFPKTNKFENLVSGMDRIQVSSSTMSTVTVPDSSLIGKAKNLAPPLLSGKHKGQAGRIGVFGGSIEFTGAPYFASIASLKVGADLVYVFTIKEAASVIKSYSPELMVLPHLDDPNAIEKIEPWLERLHVILLGPGLGRLDTTRQVFEKTIEVCRAKAKPLIIDADGLFFVSKKPEILQNYPAAVILTPNKMEFQRLVGDNSSNGSKVEQAGDFLKLVGSNVTIFCKDAEDEIITVGKSIKMSGGGSGRRCGGQGDLLGGAMSTFLAWALEKQWEPAVACYAASKLTRDCNSRAFNKMGRSMVVTDMIQEIHHVFQDEFELQ